jgi:biotin carboxyl carrier protein
MEITSEDVLAVLRVLRESDVEMLDIRLGELELHASKVAGDRHRNGSDMPAPTTERPAVPIVRCPVADSPAGEPARDTATVPPPVTTRVTGNAELVEVSAPILGIFYAASGPDAAPFVAVGSTVEEDTTVGLIEVMKSFSTVFAGVRGTVRDVVAKNAELVEYGETLVLIEPERDPN